MVGRMGGGGAISKRAVVIYLTEQSGRIGDDGIASQRHRRQTGPAVGLRRRQRRQRQRRLASDGAGGRGGGGGGGHGRRFGRAHPRERVAPRGRRPARHRVAPALLDGVGRHAGTALVVLHGRRVLDGPFAAQLLAHLAEQLVQFVQHGRLHRRRLPVDDPSTKTAPAAAKPPNGKTVTSDSDRKKLERTALRGTHAVGKNGAGPPNRETR